MRCKSFSNDFKSNFPILYSHYYDHKRISQFPTHTIPNSQYHFIPANNYNYQHQNKHIAPNPTVNNNINNYGF